MKRKIFAWRRKREARKMRHQSTKLREFVYLDEVSVTSLLSSRLGAIPSEFTESMSDSTRREFNVGVDAGVPAIKPKLGTRFESTRTENSQVLRKATIQATFKDLHAKEEGNLLLHALSPSNPVQAPEAMQLLDSPEATSELSTYLVDTKKLDRGRLLEVEVKLEADPIFRVSTIISTFSELMEKSEDISSQVDPQEIRVATQFNSILEQLMVGLVPLRCRVVSYHAASIGGREYLIHDSLYQAIPAPQRPSTRPLYLVGVAEQKLFWKDIRRVLFSEARVKVFCRLSQDGLSDSWTPVKLADVIKDIAPGFIEEMTHFGSGALQAMIGDQSSQQEATQSPQFDALVRYAELLADQHGVSLTVSSRERINEIAEEKAGLFGSVSESRIAFGAIAEFFATQYNLDIDSEVAARLRISAREAAGIPLGGAVRGNVVRSTPPPANTIDRFLEAEIVAIYW